MLAPVGQDQAMPALRCGCCSTVLVVDNPDNYKVRCPNCGRETSKRTVIVDSLRQKTPKARGAYAPRIYTRDTEDEQRQYKSGG